MADIIILFDLSQQSKLIVLDGLFHLALMLIEIAHFWDGLRDIRVLFVGVILNCFRVIEEGLIDLAEMSTNIAFHL